MALQNENPIITNKEKEMIKTKQVRAVPGGYYTGLINDMHKDYINFHNKGTFLQMEYLSPSIKHTSQSFDHLTDEKIQAPITLNSLSIQCTLPSDYNLLEQLSSFQYLIKYAKPSINRQEIISKLIRKIQSRRSIDNLDVKYIVYEYFNQYKTHEEIDGLFQFLDIQSRNQFQSNEIVILCCYAERYFLYRLGRKFERPLQEIIDFGFLKRKFHGLTLSENFKELIKTLEGN